MKTVLVVEDEIKINAIIKDYLVEAGYKVLCAFDGEEALEFFESEEIDLVVLDIMIPRIDGWSVCRRIRRLSGVPVVILTARADEDDKLLGFELGADEYVTKPFSPKVLVARISRLIERITDTSISLGMLQYGNIAINRDAHSVEIAGRNVELTPKEFDLLVMLLENKRQVLTRELILNKVWGYDFYGELRVVDSHIKKLRKKLGVTGDMIKTVIKVGYKLE